METTALREARGRGAHPAVAGGDPELLATDGDGGNVDVEDDDPRRGSTTLDQTGASRPKLQEGNDRNEAQTRACNRTGFNLEGRRRILPKFAGGLAEQGASERRLAAAARGEEGGNGFLGFPGAPGRA